MRRRRGAVLATWVGIATACANLDDLSGGAATSAPDGGALDAAAPVEQDPGPDAGPVAESGGVSVEDADAPPTWDAGSDASACNPTTTFIPSTGATSTPCNRNNVLVGVSGAAGLDYGAGDTAGELGGISVTSCLGVVFDKTLDVVSVRAAAVPKACTTGCGASCGTGRTMAVFAASSTMVVHLGNHAITTAQADYTFSVPAGVIATQVIVCRNGWGLGREDVEVAQISGLCKP